MSTVFSMLSTLLVAGYLGTENFGKLVLVISTSLLISGVLNIKTTEFSTKFLIEEINKKAYESARNIISISLLCDLFSALIAGLFIYLLADTISYFFLSDDSFSSWFELFSLTPLFVFCYASNVAILRAANKFKMLASIEVIYTFVLLSFNGFLILTNAGWQAFLWANFFAILFRGVLLLVSISVVMKQMNLSLSKNLGSLFESIKHRGKIKLLASSSVTNWLKTATLQLDIVIIGAALGTSETGTYKLAKSIVQLLAFPTNILFQLAFPEFVSLIAQKKFTTFDIIIKKLILVTFGLSIIYCIGAFFIAPYILLPLLGEEYRAVFDLLPILVIGICLLLLSQYWHAVLVALNQGFKVVNAMLVGILLQLTMFYVFLGQYGLYAAAFSYLAYCFVRFIILFLSFRSSFKQLT